MKVLFDKNLFYKKDCSKKDFFLDAVILKIKFVYICKILAIGMKKKLFKILKNRYFIVAFLFLVWMLFFDQNRLSNQIKLHDTYRDYEVEKAFYKKEIKECYAKIALLESDQDYIEKIGREKYFLKRDNEVIYYVIKDEDVQD